MVLDQRELQIASGNTGADGETFTGHVTGASTVGAGSRDYILTRDGTPVLSGFSLSPTAIADNATISVVITWPNYGSRFNLIRRNGTSPWSNAGTLTEVTINSATWDDGAGTVTLSCTVRGAYDEATLPTLTNFEAWFDGYSYPSRPADGDTAGYPVTMVPFSSTPGSPSGHDDSYIAFNYDPDNGAFNPGYFGPTSTYLVRVNRHAYPSWTTVYEWEFHTDNTYTSVIANWITSYPVTEFSWWARYRKKAAYNGGTPGSWVNYGEAGWVDPRPDA